MSISIQSRRSEILAILVVLIAFALRLFEASQTYLNPDEALIFFTAQSSEWYLRSLHYHHPPFHFLLLHGVQFISNSELGLRLISVLAGSLFPWVMWKWLDRLNFPDAALVTFLILEFSPNMIALSAQVRGYALVLLLASIALYFLEEALRTKALRPLLISTVCLYLAILTEYSAAFAVGPLGFYALIRLVENYRPVRFTLSWVLCQLGALAVYGFLYKASIATLLSISQKDHLIAGYLKGAFPQPGQDLFIFSIAGVIRQFAYLCASISMGYLGFVLFSAGILSLWFLGTSENRYLRRSLALSFSLAILLALGAALLHLHPYGRSRHTAILVLFSAPGIAFSFEWILGRFPRLSLPTAILFSAACYFLAIPDFSNLPKEQQILSNMVKTLQQLRAEIPAEALILTDEESAWMLHYYLGDRHQSADRNYANGMKESRIGSYRVFYYRWNLTTMDRLNSDLASLRKQLDVIPSHPVWVVDGGFYMLETGSSPAPRMLSNTLLLIPPK